MTTDYHSRNRALMAEPYVREVIELMEALTAAGPSLKVASDLIPLVRLILERKDLREARHAADRSDR